jgi:hypothetical protein
MSEFDLVFQDLLASEPARESAQIARHKEKEHWRMVAGGFSHIAEMGAVLAALDRPIPLMLDGPPGTIFYPSIASFSLKPVVEQSEADVIYAPSDELLTPGHPAKVMYGHYLKNRARTVAVDMSEGKSRQVMCSLEMRCT